jgi:hypothetical protein
MEQAQEPQTGGPTEDGGNEAADLHPPAPQPPAKPPRHTLCLPVPLDDKYLAQLVIPADLGRSEMLRLRRVLWSLAVPWRA